MTVTFISTSRLSNIRFEVDSCMDIDQTQRRQIEDKYKTADFATGYEDEIGR